MLDTLMGCVSAGEAARRVGISRERLIRRVQVGDLEGHLVGGRWVIAEQSLDEFITRRDARGRLPAPSNAR